MQAAPPDLSTCQDCGRPVPPTNHPEFSSWLVAKDERGRVKGMLCPACQAKAPSGEESSATG